MFVTFWTLQFWPMKFALNLILLGLPKTKILIIQNKSTQKWGKMSNFVANLLSEELRASFYSNSKDVEIICSKDNSCNIHKAVLCAVSPFLGSIFGDDEDVKIILPDIKD